MKGLIGRYDILITVFFFLLAIPAEYSEVFSAFEDQTVSLRHTMRGGVELDQNIVFVSTDEEFFQAYAGFPLRRTDIGRIAKNISDLGAAVVAVDVLLDFPSSYGEDPEAAELLTTAGNVVLVSQAIVSDGRLESINYPIEPLRSVVVTGYANIESESAVVENMSRVRIYEEGMRFDDGWPFAVQALAMYLEVEPFIEEQTLYFGDELEIPLDRQGALYIDFPLPSEGAKSFSESRSLSAREFLDLSQHDEDTLEELRYWVDGRIVLIGDTSEVSHDYFNTPVGVLYGVEIIGATIDTLQKGGQLRPAPFWAETVMTLLILGGLVASTYLANPGARAGAEMGLLVGWIALVSSLYALAGIVFSMAYVIVASFFGLLVINLRFYLQERDQKALIRDAFGQYLSPDVVSSLVKDPSKLRLGGEHRTMTAFFSDIRSFSTFAEQLSPEELVALLNEYLTQMCDIIAQYEGTVDKFEADKIVAFWGAPLEQPDHAERACHAAIDMQTSLVGYRAKLEAEGRPIVHVRIGVNTGDMVVGNLGSAQRMDYTIMGDAVNLASRLEGANKMYGTRIMISDHVCDATRDLFEVRELDRIRVVGRTEANRVYELLDRKGELDAAAAELLARYNTALQHYRKRDWRAAIHAFEHTLEHAPEDGPSITYLERCRLYCATPPSPDWDGVFELTEKG